MIYSRFLGTLFVLGLVAGSTTLECRESGQTEVNGRNVELVEFGQNGEFLGLFIQTGPRQWEEMPASDSGRTFNFTERQRDDWSVYLHDEYRGVSIQLDLHTRIVYYSDANSPRRELYQILSASEAEQSQALPQSMFDPGKYYRLSTAFRGPEYSLDIHNGGDRNNMAHLAPTANYSGQFWRITELKDGWVRLTTMLRGDTMCLDVIDGGSRYNMPYLTQCEDFSGQYWKITQKPNGSFRLTTRSRGDGMCLDIYNGGEFNNGPHLTPCANYSGQSWNFTPAD